MEMVCGLDCGKDFLDAALSRGNERLRVPNDPAGFAQLSKWLSERQAARVGIEASGGYERAVCRALAETGIEVLVLDPARVRHFAKAAGRRAKNDAIDAAMIATFLAAIPETDSIGISPALHDLAGLIKARRLLVRQRAGLIKAMALAPEAARAALADAGKELRRVIDDIGAKIRRAAAEDEALRRRVEALRSAPGIGEATAATLAVLLPELGRIDGAKIAALAGIAPYDDDSGRRHGERHIAGGRGDVREALFMATLVAATRVKDGVIAVHYRKLKAAGKRPKVALVACMRKFLVRLNAMLAADATWMEQVG